MKKKDIGIALVLLILLPFYGQSQTAKDSVVGVFEKVYEKYKDADYLSYKAAYKCADESSPYALLDTVIGSVEVNRDKYHIRLGKTEIIRSDKYNIMLFRKDTSMLVSMVQSGQAVPNLISVMDTFQARLQQLDISMVQNKYERIITINFPKGMEYKTAKFFISIHTGYLQRVEYVIKSAEIQNSAINRTDTSTTQNEWGIVTANFFHYETGKFTDAEFDDTKYFSEGGTGYKPTDTYKQYRIVGYSNF